MPSTPFPVVVSAMRQLTPRIREYTLVAAAGAPLAPFDAGAHIAVHLQTDRGPLVRHYSLVATGLDDPGGRRDSYRIAVQREARPRGSSWIHDHIGVGSRLQVSQPRNDFPLDRRDPSSLLIAGGIGITPIVSMVRSLVRRRRDFRVAYAGRAAADMAYLDELKAMAGERALIHEADRHGGRRLDLAGLLAAQPAGSGVYVCGPPAMIASVRAAAQALGWEASRVHSEWFTPPPTGDETGFELVLKASARTLQVDRHTSILEAMTAAGLQPLSDCGRGECGLCPLPVIAAEGELQHRDRYLSADEKAAGHSLCICVSRVRGSRLVLDA